MKLRDWITLGAALVLILAAFITGMRCGAGGNTRETVTVHDTINIKEIASDTVLRWFESVLWKEAKPETVFIDPDTVSPETLWGRFPEAIVSLDYSKGSLSFTSLVPQEVFQKALVKRYDYKVSDRFSIRARGQGFHVRSMRERPAFSIGIGSELKFWGDTASSRVVPYVEASVGWGGLSLGPRLDTRGIHVSFRYSKTF